MKRKKNDRPFITFVSSTLMLTLLLTAAYTTPANASELVILYSNDIRGETEPCG